MNLKFTQANSTISVCLLEIAPLRNESSGIRYRRQLYLPDGLMVRQKTASILSQVRFWRRSPSSVIVPTEGQSARVPELTVVPSVVSVKLDAQQMVRVPGLSL